MKNGANKVTLKVAETNPKLVGKGMALVDPKVMGDMGLSTGDVLEISGKKKNFEAALDKIKAGNSKSKAASWQSFSGSRSLT